jgi:uncharacterized SAM-binding protein YcdF (DUF218 family)
MFFALSKIFEFLFAPTHFILFTLVVGVGLLYTRYGKWGRRLTALSTALLALMAFGPVGAMLAYPLEARFPQQQPDALAEPDGIVVLGGSLDEELSADRGRVVFNEAAERLIAPIELSRRFPKARLVFTGGSGRLLGATAPEAPLVRQFWSAIGLDQGTVIYEDRSRNTVENALFTRDLLQPKTGERWLLITSATHMPRAVGIFRKAGFPVIAYPVDFSTSGDFWRWPAHHSVPRRLGIVDHAVHEWFGLVANRLTGKSDELFPAP